MFHDKICERHEVIVIDKQISTSAGGGDRADELHQAERKLIATFI